MNKCVLTLSIVSKLPQKSQNVKFSFESFCLVSWFPGFLVVCNAVRVSYTTATIVDSYTAYGNNT